jgi:HSP20 family protein
MSGMIPFNRNRKTELQSNGYDTLYRNMLDDFFSDGFPFRRSLGSDTFKLDVQEDEKSYTIAAELPGVKKEEIQLAIDDGKLRILVSRDENTEDKSRNYIHKERRYCSMERNIYLADADASAVKAELKDGVLNIVVPRKEKQDTSIQIDVK